MKTVNYKTVAKRYLTRIKDQKGPFKGYYVRGEYTYTCDGCSIIRLDNSTFDDIIRPYFETYKEKDISATVVRLVDDCLRESHNYINYDIAGTDAEKVLFTHGDKYKVVNLKYIKPFLADNILFTESDNKNNWTKTPLMIIEKNSLDLIGYILPVNTGKTLQELKNTMNTQEG